MNTMYDTEIRKLSSTEIASIQRVFMDLGYACLNTGEWDPPTNDSFIRFKNTHCLGTTREVIDYIKRMVNY